MKTSFQNRMRSVPLRVSGFLYLLAFLFLSGCISSTKVTGTWKNPEALKTYGNIFIASLTGNVIAKSTAESAMADALMKENITVTKSISVFPPGINNNKDSISLRQIEDKVHNDGYDAILTISLLRKTTESRYIPGNYYPYAPMVRYNYYGRFGGYYSYWYPYIYDPGYYTQDDIYFMEVNLYDAHSDALVWSAQTRTYNPSDITPVSKDFAETVVGKMKKEGLLKIPASVVKQ